MLGKLYRPTNIKNYNGKRGYKLENKLTSQLGDNVEFVQAVYMDYDFKAKSEEIVIEFENINMPIIFKQMVFKEKPVIEHDDMKVGAKSFNISIISEERVPIGNASVEILSLRKLQRPYKIKTEDGSLEMTFVITSPKHPETEDVLILFMKSVMNDGKESMIVEATCNTPVRIKKIKTLQKPSRNA